MHVVYRNRASAQAVAHQTRQQTSADTSAVHSSSRPQGATGACGPALHSELLLDVLSTTKCCACPTNFVSV
jgi:hypothetical protein